MPSNINITDTEKRLSLANEKLIRHEKILIQAYKSIKQKEEKLKTLNEELCASEEELKSNNEELQAANEELHVKNTIIEKQNAKLKATMQNLKETQAELLQSEKMASLGILTAGVAHEINNPLNYIMGAFVGLQNYFEDNPPTDKEKTTILLSSIEQGVNRASKIVDSLNQFGRNNADLNETCDISEIIDNCLVILHNRIKHKIAVKKDYEKGLGIIKGNTGKLQQVFLNILNNAEQAILDKGEIIIDINKRNSDWIIEISDSGVGISKENIKKVTDPFYTTKPPGKGTGLGLSITYNIVKEHNGNLKIRSEVGKGTTVQIIFPLV